jgi:DNA-binding HxlR family transcriptional regulator
MTRPVSMRCACPPVGLIDVVGKKWALCVVTLLGCHGSLRFGRLHSALPRVSPATLVSTLRELEHHRLIQRVPVPEDGRARGVYRLTPEGEALYQALVPLAQWLQGSLEWSHECCPELRPQVAPQRPPGGGRPKQVREENPGPWA